MTGNQLYHPVIFSSSIFQKKVSHRNLLDDHSHQLMISYHHPVIIIIITHMRSWVMGRFPSAAARWRGVRASRGETQEFTWTLMWQFYIIQHHKLTICHAVVNLDHTSSRDEWASARDTSAMSHLIQSLKGAAGQWTDKLSQLSQWSQMSQLS